MNLRDYVIRRLILLIPVLVGISILAFTLSHCVGDPAAAWITAKTPPAERDLIRAEHHLNDPLPIQYIYYLRDLSRLDLGLSPSEGDRPVFDCLIDYFPATLELAIVSIFFCLVFGIIFGILSAIKKDKWPDHILRLFSLVGVSVPIFWLGLILQMIFYVNLRILPLGNRLSSSLDAPAQITGMYLLDSILALNLTTFIDAGIHLIMPAFCLSFTYLAVISRMTRSSMLETMTQDFIRTARAKGLSEASVILKHALRNALTPTLTVAGLAFGGLLSGAVLTETIFSWPGMGRYSVKAIEAVDFASIMGFTLLVAIIYVVMNLLVDVLYVYLDPRVKYE